MNTNIINRKRKKKNKREKLKVRSTMQKSCASSARKYAFVYVLNLFK